MRQSIVLERNFQIEEAPAGKIAIGPLPVKMQCPDTVPFVPAVQDRPQTPAKPTHRLPEDLTAIASTEVVEPPLQYGLHFGADCFHRSTPGFSSWHLLVSHPLARSFTPLGRLAFHRRALFTDSSSYGSDICLRPSGPRLAATPCPIDYPTRELSAGTGLSPATNTPCRAYPKRRQVAALHIFKLH